MEESNIDEVLQSAGASVAIIVEDDTDLPIDAREAILRLESDEAAVVILVMLGYQHVVIQEATSLPVGPLLSQAFPKLRAYLSAYQVGGLDE